MIRAATQAEVPAIQALFREYGDSLGIDLEFQCFEEELASLPGAYSPPGGCLFAAVDDKRLVGCVGVRALTASVCEMKRLYVRPDARRGGLGRQLAEAAVAFARTAGYGSMRLDTLPTMTTAQAMYRGMGFQDIPPYRHNPVPGSSFLELAFASPLMA